MASASTTSATSSAGATNRRVSPPPSSCGHSLRAPAAPWSPRSTPMARRPAHVHDDGARHPDGAPQFWITQDYSSATAPRALLRLGDRLIARLTTQPGRRRDGMSSPPRGRHPTEPRFTARLLAFVLMLAAMRASLRRRQTPPPVDSGPRRNRIAVLASRLLRDASLITRSAARWTGRSRRT